MLSEWDQLPARMKTEAVRPYYEVLEGKKLQLMMKRVFDVVASFLGLIVISPVLLVLSVWVLLDSEGGVFFRQERVTAQGRIFRIHKFRSMTAGTANAGDGFYMSRANSLRVTRAGRFMRRYHLDELPQLIDILLGDMTFVGTRPEVPEYVDAYTPEMYATLLLPAGLTSEASIQFQDEGMLAEKVEDANAFYVRVILPKKMDINLRQLKEFSLAKDFACLVNTVRSIGKA